MNAADKKQAEEAKKVLQDRALDMLGSKQKRYIQKNHKKLEKIKKYIKENE